MFLSSSIYTDLKDRTVEKIIPSFSLVEKVFYVYIFLWSTILLYYFTVMVASLIVFFAHVSILDKIIVLVFNCIPSNGFINMEHEQLGLFTSHYCLI